MQKKIYRTRSLFFDIARSLPLMSMCVYSDDFLLPTASIIEDAQLVKTKDSWTAEITEVCSAEPIPLPRGIDIAPCQCCLPHAKGSHFWLAVVRRGISLIGAPLLQTLANHTMRHGPVWITKVVQRTEVVYRLRRARRTTSPVLKHAHFSVEKIRDGTASLAVIIGDAQEREDNNRGNAHRIGPIIHARSTVSRSRLISCRSPLPVPLWSDSCSRERQSYRTPDNRI